MPPFQTLWLWLLLFSSVKSNMKKSIPETDSLWVLRSSAKQTASLKMPHNLRKTYLKSGHSDPLALICPISSQCPVSYKGTLQWCRFQKTKFIQELEAFILRNCKSSLHCTDVIWRHSKGQYKGQAFVIYRFI